MSTLSAATTEVRVPRGASARSARLWAAVFSEAFGAMLTFPGRAGEQRVAPGGPPVTRRHPSINPLQRSPS